MKRILVCPLADGGVCHYTYGLADAMQRLGQDTTVFTSSYDPYDLQAFPHVHRVRRDLHLGTTRWKRLVYPVTNTLTMLREAQDTPILHFQWPSGPRIDRLQWKMIQSARKRIVYTAHDVVANDVDDTVLSHTGGLYHKADALIVHGEKLKEGMLKLVDIPAEKVHVVPLGNFNFIADCLQKWNRESARQSLGWTEDEFVALFFGFIRPYKGLDTLIAAAGILKKDCPEPAKRLRLMIVGANYRNFWDAGDYPQKIAEADMTEQTQSVVEYVQTEDIARFFLAADAITLPYKWGSQSAVLPLGYAFARPVIATDVGSLREAMIPGETALLTPPDSPSAFAEALYQLLCCPEKAAQIGRKGREYAETALSWDRIARVHLDIYERVGQ